MKIVVVTNIFPPEIGGPATYAYEILKRLSDRGNKVKIITTSEGTKATSDVYVISRHKLKLIGFIHTQLALLLSIIKNSKDCDVIYTLSPSFSGFLSLIAAKFLSKPIVLRFVGDTAFEMDSNSRKTNNNLENFLKSKKENKFIKMLCAIQRIVLNKVDKVIVPSKFLKEIIILYYQVRPEKIVVIYNSTDVEECKRVSSESSRPSGKCIITVGRLVRHKRIDGIIKVTNELVEKYPHISLLIVGNGPEKVDLEEFSREIGINSRVKFYGKATHEETIKLIREAEIFVLNSIYEGLPHVLIEAMACQTPIIATNIGGTNEVIKDGETGLLVSPSDSEELKEKIIELLGDGELKKELVENAYKSVEQKFNWDKNVGIIERELEGVL